MEFETVIGGKERNRTTVPFSLLLEQTSYSSAMQKQCLIKALGVSIKELIK
jgi:hypothetical protein